MYYLLTYVLLPGPCHLKLAAHTGLLGADAPECNADGTYKEKQCHSSTGYCWCADAKTGQEIKGTKKGPSEGDVSCGELLLFLFTFIQYFCYQISKFHVFRKLGVLEF